MRRSPARLVGWGVLAAVITAACGPVPPGGGPGATGGGEARPVGKTPGPKATGPGPAIATPSPGSPPDAATLVGKTRLVGKVRLISDLGAGLIGNNGAAVISNNGGAIVSDNGAGIVSDNGAGLVAGSDGTGSLGSGLVGKTRYGLAQAGGPTEVLLADADVEVLDAAGKALTDAAGKPITARTDRTGAYKLEAALPAGNLVLRVKLHPAVTGAAAGGELSALLPREDAPEREAPIDTETTLGAAYVLTKFVKGDQRTYDKLPAEEAKRLTRELRAARRQAARAPSYAPAEVVALAEAIRQEAPAVAAAIETIRVLLLGQVDLGAGLPATEVPLFDVTALARDAAGRLLVGEHLLGRVRAVGADGKIRTELDRAFGRVRRSFAALSSMALDPQGRLVVASWADGRVWRIDADGQVVAIAGKPERKRGPADLPALEASIVPQSLAYGRDGTLYVGEGHGEDEGGDGKGTRPRVLAIGTDGVVRKLAFGSGWGHGRVAAVVEAGDGAVWALFYAFGKGTGELWRKPAGVRAPAKVAEGLAISTRSGMVAGPDGEVWVALTAGAQVRAYAPDGASRTLAGMDGPAATRGLMQPRALHRTADGTLYVSDLGTNLVHALAPDGRFTTVAGTTQILRQSGDGGGFGLNLPSGVAFDDRGRLIVAEGGGHTVKRFDGSALETIAGTVQGYAGDGGPATAARLESPVGLAWRNGETYVVDGGNWCVRKIAADGTITTLAGQRREGENTPLQPGVPEPAATYRLEGVFAIAVDPKGVAYVSSAYTHQIVRIPGNGQVELVAGAPGKIGLRPFDPAAALARPPETGDATQLSIAYPSGLALEPGSDPPALIVADTGNQRLLRITDLDKPRPAYAIIAGRSMAETFLRTPADVIGEVGVPAKGVSFVSPAGLAFDAAGNLYVGEHGTRNLDVLGTVLGAPFTRPDGIADFPARVRKIAKDGTITTVAGPGGRHYADPDAEDALGLPAGLAVDAQGRLVVVDTGANVVRILPAGSF